MLDAPYRRSPFSHTPGGQFSLSRPGLEIAEAGFLGRILLRGAGKQFEAAASAVVGLPSLPIPLKSAAADYVTVLGLGPDEWMVICPPDRPRELLPKLHEGLKTTDYLSVDISSAFATLQLSGAQSWGVLRQGCAVPLDRLSAGDCLRTRVVRYNALIHIRANGPALDLHIGRSYARSFCDWIIDATTTDVDHRQA